MTHTLSRSTQLHGRQIISRAALSGASLSMAALLAVATPSLANSPSSTALEATSKQVIVCAQREADLGQTLEPILRDAYGAHLQRLDLSALIDRAWRDSRADDILRQEITRIGSRLSGESSWTERGMSLKEWLPKSLQDKLPGDDATGTAERFAAEVIAQTLASPRVAELLIDISAKVDAAIGNTVIAAIKAREGDAAASAETRRTFADLTKCLELNLGGRFGKGVAMLTTRELATPQLFSSAIRIRVPNSAPTMAMVGLSASALYVLQRRLVQRVISGAVSRTLGSFAARVTTSVAIPAVNTLLMAWLLVEYSEGAFPMVVGGIHDKDSLTAFRDGIREALAKEIAESAPERARQQAAAIKGEWGKLQKDFAAVLDLVVDPRGAAFKRILDDIADQIDMKRVARAVRIASLAGGKDNVFRLVETGTLTTAMMTLPESGFLIGDDLKSLEQAVAWHALAGKNLDRFAALGLHKVLKLEKENAASLSALLGFTDDGVVRRLATQPMAVRVYFAGLRHPAAASRALYLLSDVELDTLAGYIGHLDAEGQRAFDARLTSERFEAFRSALTPSARHVVLASRSQRAALDAVITDDTSIIWSAYRDVMAIANGAVSPWLLWHKYAIASALLALVALLLMMPLVRLVTGGRKTVVVIQAPATAPAIKTA